jgi:hypothetical protein
MTLQDQGPQDVQNKTGLRLSRRHAIQGAAWSVPVITVATAAPAQAFSGPSQLVLGSITATSSNFANPSPIWHQWTSGSNPAAGNYVTKSAGTQPSTTNNPAVLTVTVSGITATGSGDGLVQLAVTVNGQITSGTSRPNAQYDVDPAGWTLVGTPTFVGTDVNRPTTYTFQSTAPVVVGQVYPNLVFSCVTTSTNTSTPTVYAWTAGKGLSATATSVDATASPATISGTST